MDLKRFRNASDEWLKATVGADANVMITSLAHLTDLQYDFARAFVLCGSANKAAERVGVPLSAKPNLMVHLPKIAACINILTAKREQVIGQKSAAEIVERLMNTPLFEADDFGLSEAAVSEREATIGRPQEVTKELRGMDDSELVENTLLPADPSTAIMQLPRVNVPKAGNFGKSWIIERYVTIAERCLQIEPVYDKKGRPIGQFKFDPTGASRALEKLGIELGMFTKTVEVKTDMANFNTEEINNRIKALLVEHPSLASVIEMKEVKEIGVGEELEGVNDVALGAEVASA